MNPAEESKHIEIARGAADEIIQSRAADVTSLIMARYLMRGLRLINEALRKDREPVTESAGV